MAEITNFKIFNYLGDKNVTGHKIFNSGNKFIDDFAKTNLRQHAKAPGSGVSIITDKGDNLAGYMTLFAHNISLKQLTLSSEPVGKTPLIPVIKLGMIGVDLAYQGQGLGKELLRLAFERTKSVAQSIGIAGLYLEAAPDAISFYESFGFVKIEASLSDNTPMFLHVNLLP